MDVDEPARFELHEALRETLGQGPAGTLMSLTPPVGWADVATKQDLDHLREIVATKDDLAALEIRLQRSLHRQTWSIISAAVAVSAILTANSIF